MTLTMTIAPQDAYYEVLEFQGPPLRLALTIDLPSYDDCRVQVVAVIGKPFTTTLRRRRPMNTCVH